MAGDGITISDLEATMVTVLIITIHIIMAAIIVTTLTMGTDITDRLMSTSIIQDQKL